VLVWWRLAGDGKSSSSAPLIKTGKASSASLRATDPPARGPVFLPQTEVVAGDAVGEMVVAADPPPSAGDEEPTEALAGMVANMGITEVTNRLGQLSPEELRGEPGRLLARRWAELDPAAAGRWATQLGDVEARGELSAAVALVWSERDLPGALDWAFSLAGGDTQTQGRVLTELGYEVARVDPADSMRLAVELPASDARDGLLLHALRQWTSLEPESSQHWALQLSPGPLREQALAAVATVMANQDGERAARFVAEWVRPGPEQDRAVIGIIQRWAQMDYDQTKAWVELFPQTPLRHTALAVMADLARAVGSVPPP
jgi:hypothetical protein